MTQEDKEKDLLARLVIEARQDLQRRRALIAQDLFERAVAAYTPKDFAGALRQPGLSVIAEMKQRTPTMGVLTEDYRPADLAHEYTDGGAAAISVLTHMASFGGRPEHIMAARAATTLPILRKDFVTDPYEIAEARAAGADAVLLIVAALEDAALRDLLGAAKGAGLATLVEVHTAGELDRALRLGAPVIGINNRDLQTLTTTLAPSLALLPQIPPGPIAVSESGLRTGADVAQVVAAGAHAVLVGETLLRADDLAAKVRELSLR